MTSMTFTVSLDEQSRKLLEELSGKLDFSGPIVPKNDEEKESLGFARERAALEQTPLPTMLLRMLVESETERQRKHGFVGEIRMQGKRIQSLESDLRKANGRCIELGQFLVESSDEVRRLKAQNRTVCVRDMFIHVLPHQERNDGPTVPSEAAIRLQTRIDCEEFVEKMEALYDDPLAISTLKFAVGNLGRFSPIRKDLHDRLPEFADALADNAVTNEGFAVLFGIDLEPVFQEVHKSNLRKKDGPIDEAGKRRKPEGWVGPDVAGVLRRQGWQPSSEAKVDEPIPYALGPNSKRTNAPSHGVCDLHGLAFDESQQIGCIRCENAQYNGSEVDPIAEGEAALASLANAASKIETGQQKAPTRHAVPIDRTIWTSTAKIEIPNALVLIGGVSTACRVLFDNDGVRRRLMIEFLANDELFGHWERRRQDEEVVDISVDGSHLGHVRIASVERGRMQRDRAYNLQVEFSRVSVPWEA
jgi:predicted HAD superfamily Cof-like phosphohydrolase